MVIWIVGASVAVIVGSVVLPAFVGGAWSPTPMKRVRAMLERAQLRPNEVLYDLGAGDGRMVIAAARNGALCRAVEVDPLKALLIGGRLRVTRLGGRVQVVRENFFRVCLRDADVITAYLSPAAMEKLAPKFAAELKPGCRVVSYRRPIPDWQCVSDDEDIYVYYIPQALGVETEAIAGD